MSRCRLIAMSLTSVIAHSLKTMVCTSNPPQNIQQTKPAWIYSLIMVN